MKTEFKIKFDGQLHQVDANTLLNSLLNITAIIQEISKESDPDKKLNIKVNAFTGGSFNVDLELVQAGILGLFSTSSIVYVSGVLRSLVDIFQLKKFLKGGKPDNVSELKGGNVLIINGGENINVTQNSYHYYGSNPIINEATEKTFETLVDDPAISSFGITDKTGQPMIVVESKDFIGMTNKNTLLGKDKQSQIISDNNAMLTIFKLVFDRNRKWEFYYNGNRISAKVLDEDFFNNIDKYKFSRGDVLNVELQIIQHYDSTAKTFVNRYYEVIKVKNHIQREEPQKLEFKD